MAVILNLPSWIQPFCFSSQTHSQRLVPTIFTKNSNSFILTQLDDGSHLEFCHVGFRHCHLGFKHLVIFSDSLKNTLPPLWPWLKLIQSQLTQMMATILNSAILDSAMTQTSIHSDSTWWWQPSWILPSWIQTLPSWIQTPCYLLSDSLKNTLPLTLTPDSN